jgi:hypothetical protein
MNQMDEHGEMNIRFSQLYCEMWLEMNVREIVWEGEQWIRLSPNIALVLGCHKPSDESSGSIQIY